MIISDHSITTSNIFGTPGETYVATHSKTDIHLLRLGRIQPPSSLLADPLLTSSVPHRLPTPLLPTPRHTPGAAFIMGPSSAVAVHRQSRVETDGPVIQIPSSEVAVPRFVPDGPVIHLPLAPPIPIGDATSFYGRGMEASPGEDLRDYFHRRISERLSAPPPTPN